MRTANNCYLAKPATIQKSWYVVDATDKVVGRLAARIATVLMGKHKPTFTRHIDTGDFVVVVNAGKVKLTGRKPETKVYQRYTRHPSGLKEIGVERVLRDQPTRVLREAVRRMLPKNALAVHMLKKLKLYAADVHPHQAQQPEPLPL